MQRSYRQLRDRGKQGNRRPPQKRIKQVSAADSNEFDPDHGGSLAVAIGYSPFAIGYYSPFAIGGSLAVAIGYYSPFAIGGSLAVAIGYYSPFAIGGGSLAVALGHHSPRFAGACFRGPAERRVGNV